MSLKDEILEKLASADSKELVFDVLKENRESIVRRLQAHEKKETGILDVIQEKIVSRKLLVFVVATALLWYAGLNPETWGMIAMTYIGGQTAIDFAKVWRG
jgi:hypothetical protein